MTVPATRTISSPLGSIRLVATDEALTAVQLPGSRDGEGDAAGRSGASPGGRHPVLDQATRELEAYFAGRLRTFSVPIALEGTPFQRTVWRGLLEIPHGERRSYAWLAEKIGRPTAYRAVGAANGQNPVAIIVPCHRVIGADGSLTGYGGGLDAKRWLLDHEATQTDLFSRSPGRGPRDRPRGTSDTARPGTGRRS